MNKKLLNFALCIVLAIVGAVTNMQAQTPFAVTTSTPFFEGFESGYTNDQAIANDWVQQSEIGNLSWVANSTNTDDNRTPRSGSWNATLRYNNTDWLFRSLYLEANTSYVFEMYARQDADDPETANIKVMLGTKANKDAMSISLVPATGITNGDYQHLIGNFTPDTTGVYVLGIKGYLDNNPYYTSIDDITMVVNQAYSVTCATVANGSFSVDKAAAYKDDTVKITVTPAENYGLKNFNVTQADGTAIAVAADSTFVMPFGQSVTVSGEFWPLTGLQITCATVANGSFSVDKVTANAGDVVTITATPAEKYRLKNWQVTQADGTAIAVAADSTFVMPAGQNVTVSGEFWKVTDLQVTCATVANGSFSVNKAIANAGETIKITITSFDGYILKNLQLTQADGTAIAVAADSTFVMPAGQNVTVSGKFWRGGFAVTSATPFFEGFESGYTHDQAIANDWVQQSVGEGTSWVANNTNTDRNRTPRSGSWNATLQYDNIDWLFTPLYLEADTSYVFEMYARQDKASSDDANITVMLGTEAKSAAMSISLVPQTDITNGNYQHLMGVFTPSTTGVYMLGIKGNITNNPWYISIDDITMAVNQAYPVTCASVANGSFSVDKAAANAGDTVKITATPNDGYILKNFNVTQADGNAIAVAADSTFVMLAGQSVTVSGVFIQSLTTEVGADSLTYYLIGSEEDFVIFRDLIVARGQAPANARITADISFTENWIPVGTTAQLYSGKFNGDGHKLYNLNVDINYNGAGLFGVASTTAEFHNITIASGTIKTSAQYAAGILGYTSGTTVVTFDRCANYATISSTSKSTSLNAGGIYGCHASSSTTVSMTNCYNAGLIGNSSRKSYRQENGGLSGWLGNNATITNSYNVGTIYGLAANNAVIARYGNSITMDATYYLNTLAGNENRDMSTAAETATFANGEVAWALGEAYGQNIGTDTWPVFRNDSNQVFRVQYVAGTDTNTVYTNATLTLPAVPTGYLNWQMDAKVYIANSTVTLTQDTVITAVNSPATGLQTVTDGNLTLYPNPASDVCYLHLNGVQANILTVYDLSGRVVLTQTLSGANIEAIPVATLARGIYQVKVGNTITKFIVK